MRMYRIRDLPSAQHLSAVTANLEYGTYAFFEASFAIIRISLSVICLLQSSSYFLSPFTLSEVLSFSIFIVQSYELPTGLFSFAFMPSMTPLWLIS